MKVWFVFSGLLLAGALLFPAEALADYLADGDAARVQDLIPGTVLLRLALVGMAGAILTPLLFPDVFSGTPLPQSVMGIVAGDNKRVTSNKRWLKKTTIVVGLLSVLGLLLRFYRLGTDLWLDEISTLTRYGSWPLVDSFTRFEGANQHVFYGTLSNITISLFGATETAVRLPAVLFGVGSIIGLYYLARLLTNKREALWATALLTVSYHHIWFSQNARGWIGLLFFIVLGTGLFLKGLSENKGRTWLFYCLVMALGIFTHLNTLFVLLGHLAAYLVVIPGWQGWRQAHWPLSRRLIWVVFLVGVFTLFLHSFILHQMITFYQSDTLSNPAIGWTNPLTFLSTVAQGLAAGFLGVGVLLVGLIILLGLLSYWKQSRLLVGIFIFPIVFNVLIYITLRVGAYPRHFIYMMPFGLIIAVRGAFLTADLTASGLKRIGFNDRRAGRIIGTIKQYSASIILALVLIASAVSLIPYYRTPKQDYSGALDYIEEQAGPDDLVTAVGLAASGYRSLYGPELLFPETVEALAEIEGNGRPVWVIFTFSRDMRIRYPTLFDYIEANYENQAVFPGTVGDGTIYVLKTKLES